MEQHVATYKSWSTQKLVVHHWFFGLRLVAVRPPVAVMLVLHLHLPRVDQESLLYCIVEIKTLHCQVILFNIW